MLCVASHRVELIQHALIFLVSTTSSRGCHLDGGKPVCVLCLSIPRTHEEEGEQANEVQTFLLEYKASLCLQSHHANEKILPVFCCSSTKLASRALPIISPLSHSFAHQREPGRVSHSNISPHTKYQVASEYHDDPTYLPARE